MTDPRPRPTTRPPKQPPTGPPAEPGIRPAAGPFADGPFSDEGSGSAAYRRRTADAYDAVALPYAALARDDLRAAAPEHEVFAAFAELVRTAGGGPVAELGCGPGPVTAHLRGFGLDVFGIDLSPVMIGLARETYPDLRFEVGSMDALELADGAAAGLVSWYSVIHVPPPQLPPYFAEFRRALAPGGHLLLAFFASDADGDAVTVFDHRVTPAYCWPVDDLARLAAGAGFTETGRMVRDPAEGERFRRGHLLLRAGQGGDPATG
ncbi:class I SAM-dependent DNA methyltransferase [Streptomyces sp. NPDC003691]